jgi:serine/threonine protein kinase
VAKKRLETNLREGTKLDLVRLRTERREPCTVGKQVGVGGSAKVYSGTLDEDGSQVVLKCQRFEGPLDPAMELEISLLKSLNHRNIVPCVGVGVTKHRQVVVGYRRCYTNPMLLMGKEHVVDELLKDKSATYPHLPLDAAIDLFYELLRALRYLEQKGLVHHDVKLANLLIDPGPSERYFGGRDVMSVVSRRAYRGVLIDFGATRTHAEMEAFNKGEDGAPPPQITPLYAPPESVVERRRADGELGWIVHPSIDVYAAALVLYAMITGHPPYSHLKTEVDAGDLESVTNVKSAEGRGGIEPISQKVIERVAHSGLRFKDDKAAFDLALYRFLLPRLDPDPEKRGSVAEMTRDFVKLAKIDDRRESSGPGKKTVFLPFTQGVVEVSEAAEHPLLGAARAYGVTAEFDKDALKAALADQMRPAAPRGPTRDSASGLVFVDEMPVKRKGLPKGKSRDKGPKKRLKSKISDAKTRALPREAVAENLAEARGRVGSSDESVAKALDTSPVVAERDDAPAPTVPVKSSAGRLGLRALLLLLGLPLLAWAAHGSFAGGGPATELFAQLEAKVGAPDTWPGVGALWPSVQGAITPIPIVAFWIGWLGSALVAFMITRAPKRPKL